MDQLELNVRILNESLYDYNTMNMYKNRTLCANSGGVVPPKSDFLIPLGLTFKTPEGYVLDIRLSEDLVDKSLMLIGPTFGPDNMENELGIMVFNAGKQSLRIEEADEIATFNLIKAENLKIEVD